MHLKSLFGFAPFSDKAVNKPLLSSVEINQLMAQAGRLQVSPQLISHQFTQFGEQASSMTGSGVDFADRRRYTAGDDPRFIDWKASARSQQTQVKRYFTDVNMPSCIVIDRHSSMAYGTQQRLKITQAIRAAISVGTQILHAGNPLALLLLDDENFWQPANSSMSLFRQTIKFMARAYPPQNDMELISCWDKVGDEIKNNLPVGSRLIVISDFLQLSATDKKALQYLAFQYDVSVVQVLDSTEQVLPSQSNISLHYQHKTMKGLNNPNTINRLNSQLQKKLREQADWFKKNNCRFVRLSSHENLDALQGVF